MNRCVQSLGALALALAAAGCSPDASYVPEPTQLEHRLRALKTTYYEYEPLDLVLVTTNPTARPRTLGLQERGGTIVLHELRDNDQASWRPIPIEQDVVPQQVMPGETVDLLLSDPTGRVRLTRPGTWALSYRFFQQTGAREKLIFATADLHLQCVAQPLNLPAGTPEDVADAIKALAAAPAHVYASQYPSWTKVNSNEAMDRLRAMGDRAAPALLANLDHYRIRPAVIQLLADLRYAPAVPRLLERLKMNEGTQDRLILTALAAITGLPRGLEYYTYWDRPETKEDALAAYRAWTGQRR